MSEPAAPPSAKFVQIAVAGQILYALADDGSLYRLTNPNVEGITPNASAWERILGAAPY
jgi:hypothetical protein